MDWTRIVLHCITFLGSILLKLGCQYLKIIYILNLISSFKLINSSLISHPSLSLPLATRNLCFYKLEFLLLVFFLESTYKSVHITYLLCLTFSLSIMPSRSIHVLQMARFCSFLWMCNSPLHVLVYIQSFLYSPSNVCLHILAIVSNAAINMGVHISFQISAFILFI